MAESGTAKTGRPLSPHLQVYRWTVTMASSIFHRFTGVALGIGTLWLVWWLLAASSGGEAFAAVQAFSGSIIGRLVLLAFTWSLMYHLLNGIRHLAWDAGYGFEVKTATITGWAVFIGATVL
ncbi:MAG: succinate dehydrogenase, cytochrome b556 subunit, partial [Alphaproteobacteria bacterium]|nr:succinate dehydrogenase, cytochrome b556 subunit [Alphaproteobacteria bacterium]